MSERKGLVSILIPCYNHEKFVADCLESILNQTYLQYEVIICDDCSKDRSVSVIRNQRKLFEEKGIHFVLIENEKNCGITRNLNRMLREANGEFVKIIASDDMLEKTYLLEMVTGMQENPTVKILFSNGYKIAEAAAYPVHEKDILEPMMEGIPECRDHILERIYAHNFVPAPTLMIRHHVLKEVGGYDESIGIEDLEMLLRILQRYPQGLGACNKKLVYYRMNDNSITSMVNNAGAKKRIKFMHRNSVMIARKYKGQVSSKIYCKRVYELYKEYWLKCFIIFVKNIKR